jgi:PAS domain S-box-containing protein
MVEDITERKEALEQIAEQAAIIDIAPAGIMVCDFESNILFWNKGAETIYGWSRREALGRTIPDLLFPEEGPGKFIEILQAVLNDGVWEGEVHQMTRDKKRLVLESRRVLMRNAEGHPKSVLMINTDITEKRRIEAQSMRAQRLESIGTLAGGIAHDLNNVLAPILMSISLLRLSARDAATKGVIDAIESSARRGASIVKQVLSFARGIEGERTEIQPKNLFKEIDQIIRDTFPKNIELHVSIPHYLWTIVGDPTQLHQVLLNLCINSRDAMPGGGHLTITAENRHLDEQDAAINQQAQIGPYVILSVTDTGTGIPADVLDKIFDPFFTTKASGQGTGLGLSMTMGIVKSHGGFITVYSEPGRGSTFRVHLPVETAFEITKRKTQPVGLPRGNGETILVVDDESSLLAITSQALLAFGYKVRTATNGAQAVTLYTKHHKTIAAVITDMAMPIMDGPTFIKTIKKSRPDVKIIATSGLHDDGSMTRATAAGVRYFLNKPCTTGTLLKTLQEVLNAPVQTKTIA